MKTLYGRSSNKTWKVYKPFHTRTRDNRHRFRVQSELQELPHANTLWSASATLLWNGDIIFTGAFRCPFIDPDKLSLLDLLEDDEATCNWMWKDTALETESAILARGLKMGEATLIADGSWYRDLDPTKWGVCWILETEGKNLYQAAGCLQSTGDTASAYRSELVGIYGANVFFHVVVIVIHSALEPATIIADFECRVNYKNYHMQTHSGPPLLHYFGMATSHHRRRQKPLC